MSLQGASHNISRHTRTQLAHSRLEIRTRTERLRAGDLERTQRKQEPRVAGYVGHGDTTQEHTHGERDSLVDRADTYTHEHNTHERTYRTQRDIERA